MVAVHQFVPSYAGRGAIGFHTHQVTLLLREMGVRSHTYVGDAREVEDREVFDYRSYAPVAGEPTIVLYQLSTGHPMADFLAERPEPLVVNYHNVTPVEYIQPWEPLLIPELKAGRDQLRRLAAHTELAIAVSDHNAAEMADVGYRAPLTVPVLVDFEGLGAEDDPRLSAQLARIKAGGGADLVFVGRIAPNKAQHNLIKALVAYRHLYDPLARLWLVGATSSIHYRTALSRFADELGVGDAVTITGSVRQAQLVSYYRNAGVFVSASEHEGFGVPLLEAMWHSVPVVAVASSAVGETIGGAGVVVTERGPTPSATLAAAIHRVTSDATLRGQLIERGHIRVGQFSLKQGREAFQAALQPLLGAGPVGSSAMTERRRTRP